jgi:hypothetical protein
MSAKRKSSPQPSCPGGCLLPTFTRPEHYICPRCKADWNIKAEREVRKQLRKSEATFFAWMWRS